MDRGMKHRTFTKKLDGMDKIDLVMAGGSLWMQAASKRGDRLATCHCYAYHLSFTVRVKLLKLIYKRKKSILRI